MLPHINIKNTNPNDLIRYTLRVKEKLEQLKEEKNGMNQKVFEAKSIGRNKKIIQTKSMTIDNWLDAKKRITKNSISSKNKHEKDAIDMIARYNIGDNQFYNELLELNSLNKTATSYRELRNLSLLDKIDKRLRNELQKTIRNIIRLQSQQEFNSIVERIKLFLEEIENVGLISNSQNSLKLYKLV